MTAAATVPAGVEGHRIGARVAPTLGPASLWQSDDMRAALRSRDIAAVYRLLQRYGIAQRRIAAATGMAQSDVSAVIKGRRVVSYDVLVRIADGLGVPRGWMGLASFDDEIYAAARALLEAATDMLNTLNRATWR